MKNTVTTVIGKIVFSNLRRGFGIMHFDVMVNQGGTEVPTTYSAGLNFRSGPRAIVEPQEGDAGAQMDKFVSKSMPVEHAIVRAEVIADDSGNIDRIYRVIRFCLESEWQAAEEKLANWKKTRAARSANFMTKMRKSAGLDPKVPQNRMKSVGSSAVTSKGNTDLGPDIASTHEAVRIAIEKEKSGNMDQVAFLASQATAPAQPEVAMAK